jgi:hypothetical protein
LVEVIGEEHDHALEEEALHDNGIEEMLPFDYQKNVHHVEVDEMQVSEHVHDHHDNIINTTKVEHMAWIDGVSVG